MDGATLPTKFGRRGVSNLADEPLRDDATVDAVPRRIAVHYFSKGHATLSTEFDCRGVLGVLEEAQNGGRQSAFTAEGAVPANWPACRTRERRRASRY